MRIAYLDCFAGISGDMFLGAMIDAGVDPKLLLEAVAALHLGASLRIHSVDRSGITATKVDVLEGEHLAESAHSQTPHISSAAAPAETSASFPEQVSAPPLQQQLRMQHLHKGGHTHANAEVHTHTDTHSHAHSHHHGDEQEPQSSSAQEHAHGRSLSVIRDLIQKAPLAEPVKNLAVHAFELLGASEAKIHNVPIEDIHFHEVGAVDAIIDIVAASTCIHALNQQALEETGSPIQWNASPLNVGGGMVKCAHGTFPVPAPATADLLRGFPTYSAHVEKELVTPTGAALLRALPVTFGPQPAMTTTHIGYGAGTRNPEGFPNVLRLFLGEAAKPAQISHAAASANNPVLDTQNANATPVQNALGTSPSDLGAWGGASPRTETVTLLETALDDLSPQVLAYVTELVLAAGALDVMSTPVTMKKGRLGTLLTVLTDETHALAIERILFEQTTTLGIRTHTEQRSCLSRAHTTVETPFGAIRMKVGSLAGQELNAAPEFADAKAAADVHQVPLKRVLQAAQSAYANSHASSGARFSSSGPSQ